MKINPFWYLCITVRFSLILIFRWLYSTIDNKKMIGNVYNCASGISVSILDLAKQVSSLLGKPNHPIEFEDWKPGDIKHFDVSNENLKDLGFKWNTSFEDGLNQTLAWSKNWINNLKN